MRDWQRDVLDLVRHEGADKRTTARFLALGVNGLGVALMVVVFAHTAGALVGAEAGIAGGKCRHRARSSWRPSSATRPSVASPSRPARRSTCACTTCSMTSAAATSTSSTGSASRTSAADRLRSGRSSARRPAVRRGRAPCGRKHDVSSLVEGAKRLVGRGNDAASTHRGPAPCCGGGAWPAGRRTGRRGRRGGRAGRRAADAGRRPHRGGAGRRHRLGQVLDVQRTGRHRPRRHRRTPPDDVVDDGLRLGRRRGRRAARLARGAPAAPGLARQHARRGRRRTATSPGWSCSTCPTTTPPRSPTTSRSTGWSR